MLGINEYGSTNSVFKYFEQISKIPRGSGNTKKIAEELVKFAKARGLEHYIDKWNNVLIKKPASIGRESRPPLILQGHTDMVAEKTEECKIDMQCEAISIYRDGDYITADGTTLGADDGIAVAYILSILDRNDIEHPKIEALFTSDEEIGLIGATGFDTSLLEGKMLINLDSEDEGIFTVGCAGGVRLDMVADFTPEECSELFRLKISGLLGGHSGVEIDKGRANAAKLAAKILTSLGNIRLSFICGGSMDNAIMHECECLFATDDELLALKEALTVLKNEISAEYRNTDGNIKIELEKCSEARRIYSDKDTKKILRLLCDIPSGVVKMSEDIPGLPETSANIGILRIDAECGECRVTSSLRSSKSEEKQKLKKHFEALAKSNGFALSARGDYPAWEYKVDSKLRSAAVDTYRRMYEKEPTVLTIHAGLECGIFSDKISSLDCISIGPDMKDIHTTEERLCISSAVRVYEFLLEILRTI